VGYFPGNRVRVLEQPPAPPPQTDEVEAPPAAAPAVSTGVVNVDVHSSVARDMEGEVVSSDDYEETDEGSTGHGSPRTAMSVTTATTLDSGLPLQVLPLFALHSCNSITTHSLQLFFSHTYTQAHTLLSPLLSFSFSFSFLSRLVSRFFSLLSPVSSLSSVFSHLFSFSLLNLLSSLFCSVSCRLSLLFLFSSSLLSLIRASVS
jgi:hypothetical protein